MSLDADSLRQLAEIYDQWQATLTMPVPLRQASQDQIRLDAEARGPEFARAFLTMLSTANTPNTDGGASVLPLIPDAVRSAAIAQSPSRHGTNYRAQNASSAGLHNLETTPPQRQAGQQVGPYRLIRELGRGGMGVVWLAARADGQHERQVALKMPLVENLNWLLAARFARERNILASLEHPGIARLYDAGVDEATQPYIAIEYVQGRPITAYVKEKKLAPEGVVQLFGRVIEAVAHAHAQLVIHRDIKPANILVDAKGEPHLLDFGIAKLLDDEDSEGVDATQLTRLSGRALTLDYASPEQINNAPLGTPSDVYSLGVVLYELLTGQRPYEPKGATRRDLEIAILEQEPGKPSDQLLRTGDSESGKSARRMRGDLDTIVLKALRKEPTQRYATAQAFADDLKRYLAFEPILARPDRFAYRLRKFLRRQRLPLIIAAAGCAAVAVMGVRALQQQQLAQASSIRADSIDGLMQSIFHGMSPAIAASRNFSTKELLDRAQSFVNDDDKLDAATRRAARLRMAALYIEIGAFPEALAIFVQEHSLASRLDDPRAQAEALWNIANVSSKASRTDQARQALVSLREQVQKIVPASNEMSGKLALVEGNVALTRQQPANAMAHYRSAEALFSGDSSAHLGWRAWAVQGQGSAATDLSQIDTARTLLNRAYELYGRAGIVHRVDQLQTEYLIAELDIAAGHFRAALTRLNTVLPDLEGRVGSTDDYVLSSLQLVTKAQIRLGLLSNATGTLARLSAANTRGNDNLKKFVQLYAAQIQMYGGDASAAERTLSSRLNGVDLAQIDVQHVRRAYAESLLRLGRTEAALTLLRDVEARFLKVAVEPDTNLAVTRVVLACALARSGDLEGARSRNRLALNALLAGRGPHFPATLVAQSYDTIFGAIGPIDKASAGPIDNASTATELADRVQRELGWQSGASALEAWLRDTAKQSARLSPEKWLTFPAVL